MRSKKSIINTISYFLLQIITLIFGFIIPKMIIKNYGSNVNGLISSITNFLAYITLLEAGFGPVIKALLYKPIANNDKKTISMILKSSERFFRIISYIYILYVLVLCFILPNFLSDQFDVLYTLSLLIIISTSTFFEYYFGIMYKLYLNAEQKSYVVSIIQIITIILNSILTIVLIRFNVKIQIVKLVSSILFFLRPILQQIYVKKKYNINLKDVDSYYKIPQKWDALGQHIASVIHNNIDIVVLTIFTNSVEVSVYSIYLLIINGVKNLVQSFNEGVYASFGDMIAKEEHVILNKSFNIYEMVYYLIITVAFICTLLLIVPFIDIYTAGITDANYHRPLFSYIFVLAEFIWLVRLPYNSLILAAGHFKQINKGAWVEAGINALLSIILVQKFGIMGVAIGTLVAMAVRAIEFGYYASAKILKRNIGIVLKRIFVMILEIILILIIYSFIPKINVISYLTWVIQAFILVFLSMLIIITINFIVYKNDIKSLINIIKNILMKGKIKNEKNRIRK